MSDSGIISYWFVKKKSSPHHTPLVLPLLFGWIFCKCKQNVQQQQFIFCLLQEGLQAVRLFYQDWKCVTAKPPCQVWVSLLLLSFAVCKKITIRHREDHSNRILVSPYFFLISISGSACTALAGCGLSWNLVTRIQAHVPALQREGSPKPSRESIQGRNNSLLSLQCKARVKTSEELRHATTKLVFPICSAFKPAPPHSNSYTRDWKLLFPCLKNHKHIRACWLFSLLQNNIHRLPFLSQDAGSTWVNETIIWRKDISNKSADSKREKATENFFLLTISLCSWLWAIIR